MALVAVNTINVQNSTYTNKAHVASIDLANVTWVDNSMSRAFAECKNLTTVKNIPGTIKDLSYAFKNCTKLVNHPTIPITITNMCNTYSGCNKITSMPSIPASVTDLSYCFYNCRSMVNISTIPNSVTNVIGTFQNCISLTESPNLPANISNITNLYSKCASLYAVPHIPEKVTSMDYTFENCVALQNNIYISSTNVASAKDCFVNTSTPKNVYIPFFTNDYNHSQTYNTFIAEGYDAEGTKHGVYLKDINDTRITVKLNGTPENATGSFSKKYILAEPLYAWKWVYADDQPGQTTVLPEIVYTKSTDPAINDYIYDDEGEIMVGQTYEGNVILAKGTTDWHGYKPDGPYIEIFQKYIQNGSAGQLEVRIQFQRYEAGDIAYKWINITPIAKNTIELYDVPTIIKYTVSAPNYFDFTSDEITIQKSEIIPYELTPDLVTFTVTPNPQTATVTLTSGTSTVTGTGTKAITVFRGSNVTYNVALEGWTAPADLPKTITVNNTDSVTVALTQNKVTYTLTPNPIGATVTLAANGYDTVSGTGTQSISVEKNTVVTYTLTKDKWYTKTDSITVDRTFGETIPMDPIPQLELIFENNVGGTYSVTIPKNDTYYVELVGAGGGGSYAYAANRGGTTLYRRASGGSGGYTATTMNLNAGTYSITVGAGGTAGGNIRNGTSAGGTGGASTFQSASANGGTGGTARVTSDGAASATAGSGGTGSTANGNSGMINTTQTVSTSFKGGATVYPNASDDIHYGEGGRTIAGYAGYARVYHYYMPTD